MKGAWLWLVLAACRNDPIALRVAPVDIDGDGFASVGSGGNDCDDTRQSVNPEAPEVCGDGLDNNCDGRIDDAGLEGVPVYEDLDGDGYGAGLQTWACKSRLGGLSGVSEVPGDCDDTRAEVNPGAHDRCNGIDEDCDGVVDDDEVAFEDGVGRASLAEAVAMAASRATLQLCPSMGTVRVGTVAVGASTNVTIRGPGADLVVLKPADGPLVEMNGGRVVIEGVRLSGAHESPALVVHEGHLELRDVVADGNTAGVIDAWGDLKGRLIEVELERVTLAGNGNETIDGGAIRAVGGVTLSLLDSEVRGNVGARGGGFFIGLPEITSDASRYGPRHLAMHRTVVVGNRATEGGGAYIHRMIGATITDSTISGNEATVRGGGLALLDTTLEGDPDVYIAGNESVDGGGVYLQDSGLSGVRVVANRATANGGGVYAGGGAGATLFDTVLDGNEALHGGGLHVGVRNPVQMSFCRVQGNDATVGGGVYLDVTGPTERSTLEVLQSAFGEGKTDNWPIDVQLSNRADEHRADDGPISFACDSTRCYYL